MNKKEDVVPVHSRFGPIMDGVYNSPTLPEYNAEQSYMGSYEPGRDILLIHELGDCALMGVGELQSENRRASGEKKWFDLVESLTIGSELDEKVEAILPELFARHLKEVDRDISQWERVYTRRDAIRLTSDNLDILRAAWVAGAYVMQHPGTRVVTNPPSKYAKSSGLQNEGIGYVADLAGFGVGSIDGVPVVHAAVAGRDFRLGLLPHQNIRRSGEHSAILIDAKR